MDMELLSLRILSFAGGVALGSTFFAVAGNEAIASFGLLIALTLAAIAAFILAFS
jgi:hypothetical protein